MKRETLRNMTIYALALSVSFYAAGCGKKVVKTEEGLEPVIVESPDAGSSMAGDQVDSRIESEGIGKEESLRTPSMEDSSPGAVLEGRSSAPMLPVYFDFDQSSVKEDMRERLEMASAFLKDNPAVQIRIEGNCDERGTNEYNMALGERRGQSAKKYLMLLGIDESRMNTISYGEERPLNYGHDELSWSQNRRDDFVIVR